MRSKVIEKIKKSFLDAFFPKFCFGCKKEGRYLCSSCTLFLSEAAFICPDCGKVEYFGKSHKSCRKRRHLDGLVSLWDYEGLIKKLIREGKYRSLIDVYEELVEYGFYTVKKNRGRFSLFLSFLFEEDTVITFVPLYKKKERRRGFNQAEEIAKNIGRVTKKDVFSLLKKEKETLSQTRLTKEERRENVKAVFSCNYIKKKIPKNIVLVDDVWTSGATMRECCRVLKENGAKKVWGFTIAKTA